MGLSDLPAAARARIERETADAETAFIRKAAEPVRLEFFSDEHLWGATGGETPGDLAAVEYVVRVGDVVVRTVCDVAVASRQLWPPERVRAAVDDWLDEQIPRAYERKHSKRGTTLAAFTTTVHEALRTSASWTHLQDTIQALSAVHQQEANEANETTTRPSIRSVRNAQVETLTRALAAKGWSRRKWADVSGVSPSVVYGLFADRSTPNAESRASLAKSLNIPLKDLPE